MAVNGTSAQLGAVAMGLVGPRPLHCLNLGLEANCARRAQGLLACLDQEVTLFVCCRGRRCKDRTRGGWR